MYGKKDLFLKKILIEKKKGGVHTVFKHFSSETKCDMKFSVFVPTVKTFEDKFYALFFLPGMGMNEFHFINRTEVHEYAVDSRFVVVCPDTSPRVDLPQENDETETLVGDGQSWYIDATEMPFSEHYKMYSYVANELYEIILKQFPVYPNFAICGHSMGGAAAICMGLRNPKKFTSISAFCPIANPTVWAAEQIFNKLLGKDNLETWKLYDSYEIVKSYDGPRREILIDQGAADEHLQRLNPEKLVEAGSLNPKGEKGISIKLRMHEGMDHSYHLVKKLWKDHFDHHQRLLFLQSQGIGV